MGKPNDSALENASENAGVGGADRSENAGGAHPAENAGAGADRSENADRANPAGNAEAVADAGAGAGGAASATRNARTGKGADAGARAGTDGDGAYPAGKSAAPPIRRMAAIGVMTAVTCILGPLSIPIGPVPISLTMLAIFFSLYLLGMKAGVASYLIYLLIGLIGVPVFSSFTGGPQKLLGPTGGYLIGFLPMAAIAGVFIDRFALCRKRAVGMALCMAGMALGTAACYALGTAWLAFQSGMSLSAALLAGVIPFIPGDLLKIILAAALGPKLRSRLARTGLSSRA